MQNQLSPLDSSDAETLEQPSSQRNHKAYATSEVTKESATKESATSAIPTNETLAPLTEKQTVREKIKQLKPVFKLEGATLRSRLLQTILPTVLIPLVAASFTGYRVISTRSEERLQTQIENQALLASEASTAVLDDLLDLPRTVANSPLVINEARTGSEEASAAGLDQTPIEQLEADYADTKLLRQHTALNTYLQQTVETAEISEILVTDKHGFNVAYSRPVADLVQRDEAWWQNGKENEQWIGPPDFDFASKGFTVELVQSIRDPQNNDQFVGIIRAILPTRKFSLLADTLQRTGISGSQRVQLIDGERLSTIDTFSAQGFHKDRNIIGGEPVEQFISYFVELTQAAPSISESTLVQLIAIPGIERVSLPVADEKIQVASFVSNGRQFKIANIASSNWVAIASMDNSEISATGRDSLIFFSLFTLLLGAVTTALIFWLSRQLLKPIDRLTKQAEIAASGDLDVIASPSGTSETRFLTQTFNQLVSRAKELIQSQSIETQKVQLFADITSAPISNVAEISPLLTRILPIARDILDVERLAFYQVQSEADFINPYSQSTDRRSQESSNHQIGRVIAESVSVHTSTAEQLGSDAEWLPNAIFDAKTGRKHIEEIEGEEIKREAIKASRSQQKQASARETSAPSETAQYDTVSAQPFADASKHFSGLYVPVFYKIDSSEDSQETPVLWGYLIAHSYRDHRSQNDHRWNEADTLFLERLSLQLNRVLDRIAAGEVVKKSHQEVQRFRQATEVVTRNQQQQQETYRQHSDLLKEQVAALSQDISGVFDGDLTVRARASDGDLSDVADTFNTTVAKLQELVSTVKTSTTEIDEALGSNEQAALQLAQLTEQQSKEAIQTLETIRHVSDSIDYLVTQSKDAAAAAHQITDKSQQGQTAIDQVSTKIRGLNDTSHQALNKIGELNRSAQNVSYMVEMIASLATDMQTLSERTSQRISTWTAQGRLEEEQNQQLNQIATEMASVAKRSIAEAGLIDTFLNSVRATTQQMSEAIDNINREIKDGNQTVLNSQQSLNDLLSTARQFEQLAQTVHQATEEQSYVSQTASELVEQIASLSEQTTQFSAAIAQSLQTTTETAHRLRTSVDFFKVSS